ncbi:MAG: adenylyltransferase/cytidyltransferase family protein [Thermodesulfobacteriota bacterium]
MGNNKAKKVVAVSGGFDPIHLGHLCLLKEARKLGDKLVVIINDDEWIQRKKGIAFMNEHERAEIIREFECVDRVYIDNSSGDDVSDALKVLKPDIFANGGDRKSEADIPEAKICSKLGIKMVFNVGGKKRRSSSKMLNRYCAYIIGGEVIKTIRDSIKK